MELLVLLGAAVRKTLLGETDDFLTHFSRSAERLNINSDRERIISGSVTNSLALDKAMKGQEVVFAALSDNLAEFARDIVVAMKRNDVQRRIFITSMGIYGEVLLSMGGTLEKVSPVLCSYREAADVIEASDLNYTIIRSGWVQLIIELRIRAKNLADMTFQSLQLPI